MIPRTAAQLLLFSLRCCSRSPSCSYSPRPQSAIRVLTTSALGARRETRRTPAAARGSRSNAPARLPCAPRRGHRIIWIVTSLPTGTRGRAMRAITDSSGELRARISRARIASRLQSPRRSHFPVSALIAWVFHVLVFLGATQAGVYPAPFCTPAVGLPRLAAASRVNAPGGPRPRATTTPRRHRHAHLDRLRLALVFSYSAFGTGYGARLLIR